MKAIIFFLLIISLAIAGCTAYGSSDLEESSNDLSVQAADYKQMEKEFEGENLEEVEKDLQELDFE